MITQSAPSDNSLNRVSLVLPRANVAPRDFSTDDLIAACEAAGFFELCRSMGSATAASRVLDAAYPIRLPESDGSHSLLATITILWEAHLSGGAYLAGVASRIKHGSARVHGAIETLTELAFDPPASLVHLKQIKSSEFASWFVMEPGIQIEVAGVPRSYESIPAMVADGWYPD